MNANLREQVERVKKLVAGRASTDGPRLLREYIGSLREAIVEIENLERLQRSMAEAGIGDRKS